MSCASMGSLHSYFNLSTGFKFAVRIDFAITTANAIINTDTPGAINNHHCNDILSAKLLSQLLTAYQAIGTAIRKEMRIS